MAEFSIAKMDEKIRENTKDILSRTELMISNSSLTTKDAFHSELRNLEERMDEHFRLLATKIERNTQLIEEVKTSVSRLKAALEDNREKTERDERRIRKDEESSQTNADNLESLKKNVKSLFDEYNEHR